MTKSNFTNLKVYQLAEQLADAVWDVVTNWEYFAKDTIGKQIVRSADSVGANIAEGEGRGSFQDNRRFVRMARGSLKETQHFLYRPFNRKRLPQKQIDQLKPIADEPAPRLNAYLKSIGTRHNQRTTGNGPRTRSSHEPDSNHVE